MGAWKNFVDARVKNEQTGPQIFKQMIDDGYEVLGVKKKIYSYVYEQKKRNKEKGKSIAAGTTGVNVLPCIHPSLLTDVGMTCTRL